ncbi:ABC transporter permease [Flexithrix dorotheae]|uniref:ABC transporter permease n=1 Tax=Flexithrix dorotheae TaxID=70993 RepID=UPI00035C8387|nr:ABC transporter permease [Flexithrix dorotheae]
MWNTIAAEWVKLNNSSVWIWVILGGLGVSLTRLVLYAIGPEAYTLLAQNPWESYLNMNLTYFSLLIFPLVILAVISIVNNQEHRIDSWKVILTLPNPRWELLGSKLLTILILLATIFLLFVISTILFAYPIYWIHPETEFAYFQPLFFEFASDCVKVFGYSLGIVGLQFFFSIAFKNSTFPIILGIAFYLVGFLLFMALPNVAVNFPYSLPFLYKDIGISQSIDVNNFSGMGIRSCLVFACSVPISYMIFITRR